MNDWYKIKWKLKILRWKKSYRIEIAMGNSKKCLEWYFKEIKNEIKKIDYRIT